MLIFFFVDKLYTGAAAAVSCLLVIENVSLPPPQNPAAPSVPFLVPVGYPHPGAAAAEVGFGDPATATPPPRKRSEISLLASTGE